MGKTRNNPRMARYLRSERSMIKRLFNATAIAVIIFLQAGSLVYACPYFYSPRANTPVASTDRAPGHRSPCGGAGNNSSSSSCYRTPYNLVSPTSTGISFSSPSMARDLLTENSSLSHAQLPHAPVVTAWNIFPRISLVFLYQVLRI